MKQLNYGQQVNFSEWANFINVLDEVGIHLLREHNAEIVRYNDLLLIPDELRNSLFSQVIQANILTCIKNKEDMVGV